MRQVKVSEAEGLVQVRGRRPRSRSPGREPGVLKHANPHDEEQARKLGRASSRGPEAPIVVYNDPAQSRGQTRSPRRRTGCSNRGDSGSLPE
ncbi:hypothetical protein IEO21_10237 [Rhodonia placenta]|uniref:Uncharacterized protein n=1 Tax=Rhodonia placenta TaxID=104341 RepID=A0A8H7TXH4_9APHY|nr:hypothetical protein IEO21_10237 [Postia placenta]